MSEPQFRLTYKATGEFMTVTAQTDLARLKFAAPEWMPLFQGAPIYSSRLLIERAIDEGKPLELHNWKLEPLDEAQP